MHCFHYRMASWRPTPPLAERKNFEEFNLQLISTDRYGSQKLIGSVRTATKYIYF